MRRVLIVILVLLVDKKINGRYYLVNGAMYLVTPIFGELIQSDWNAKYTSNIQEDPLFGSPDLDGHIACV